MVNLHFPVAAATVGALLSFCISDAHAQRAWLGASTTSTTMLPLAGCSQPITSGATPLASDCLWILNVAVGVRTCDVACLCAPKGTLPVTATDALVCLRVATGANVALQCPCDGSTTTTSTTASTTLVSTTTTIVTTTSTSTTTTTLDDPLVSGRELYDSVCAGCHRAGSHDTSGFAPDLAGKGSRVVNNLGSIDAAMSSITLTNQEVADVAAFLNSL
jgi:cytochrome c2